MARTKIVVPTLLPHKTIEDRAVLCEAAVSIDGYHARIMGYRSEFAVVRAKNGISAEFAWATVARVIAKGGSFNS